MNVQHFFAQAGSSCTLNGNPIDCGELADKAGPFLGLGIGALVLIIIVSIAFSIAVFVFWLLMLLHALKYDSKDRTLWIALLIGSWFIGLPLIAAGVYYFVEKKNAERQGLRNQPSAPPGQQ